MMRKLCYISRFGDPWRFCHAAETCGIRARVPTIYPPLFAFYAPSVSNANFPPLEYVFRPGVPTKKRNTVSRSHARGDRMTRCSPILIERKASRFALSRRNYERGCLGIRLRHFLFTLALASKISTKPRVIDNKVKQIMLYQNPVLQINRTTRFKCRILK